MFSNLSAFFILLVELLSLGNLSSINDNDNQYQVQLTNILVNQPRSSTILSAFSGNIRWIKGLKNITENRGESVILECEVTSSYPVSFRWYRYNNLIDRNRFFIDDNAFRSSIHMNNLRESQTGFYTCEVSNGFQTLRSNGFVRLKKSDLDAIESNDDLLPSIEFQPEIILNDDGLIDTLKCEIYQGNICRSIIGSKYISLISLTQKEIEQNLIDNLQYLSNECRHLLLPMVCYFVYPICNTKQMSIQSICRSSCYYYQNSRCMKELFDEKQLFSNFRSSYNIPTCDTLPPSSDDETCIKIDQNRNISSLSSIFINQGLFSSGSWIEVFIKSGAFVVLISALILFFGCCYLTRRRKAHLYSCSSSLEQKNKSSSILTPIQSSPLHSPISITQIHPHHQNIKSSSSAVSTYTNFTNIHQRQSYLKLESDHLQRCIPFGDDLIYDVPITNIRFLEEIGQGEFGLIYVGEFVDNKNKCIIKTLQNSAAKEDYLQEIEIFRHIHHSNISCLIGICVESKHSLSSMIYECLNNGDLHEYLVLQCSNSMNLNDFFYVALQIVSGMIYLTEKNILHNDLSARNILTCEHMNVKITNIGRYNQRYRLDYYNIANHLLPVRWMSLESILSGVYSEMSDVWSFGVLLWEILSNGIQPYFGHTNPEVIEMIRDRILLPCPLHCPKKIYSLMSLCWQEEIQRRPKFIELMQRLKQLQEKYTKLLPIDDELIAMNQLDLLAEKYRASISSNE